VYEQRRIIQRKGEKLPANAQAFLFSFKCKPSPCDSSSSWTTSEGAPFSASNSSSPETIPSPTPQPSFPVSPEESHYSGCDPPHELIPQENSSPEMQLMSLRGESFIPHMADGSPTFSYQFSPLYSVPHPLHVSFPFSNPEHFQIFDTAFSELDLSSCAFTFIGCSFHVLTNLIQQSALAPGHADLGAGR
jgi:hypothetical protein